MPETDDTPPVPAEPKIDSVMSRLRALRTKPTALKQITFDRLRRLGTKSSTDPQEALEEPAEEESKTATDTLIESHIVDPEIEYQRALDEIRADNKDHLDPFDVFKQFTKPDRNTRPEPSTRRFTALDKARHKLLGIQAQRQGITNIGEFNRLVECLETELKGLREDGTYNISSDNIPVIKAFLDTGIDTVAIIKALKSNTSLYGGLLNPENLKYESDTAVLIKLLKAPNIQELLPLIQGMSRLPHGDWQFRSGTSTQSPIDELISIAEQGTIPDYSPEFFDKVGIIARSLGITVQLEDLPAFERLINNPDKLQFLATTMKSGNFDECFSRWGAISPKEPVCDVLDSLDNAGLTMPLTRLMQSKISLNSRTDETRTTDYDNRSQDQINQDLLRVVTSPETQAILADQERQEFAQILMKMARRPVTFSEVNELFENRKDFVALNKMIFGSLGRNFIGDYSTGNKIKALSSLLTGKEGRRQILLSPSFQQFIIDLQQTGIILEPRDYFRYEVDVFDYQEHPKHQSVLVQLYQGRELIKLLDPGISKSIIEGGRIRDGRIEREIAMADMQRLKIFGRYISTFELLNDAGIPIPQGKLRNADWIAQIQGMPLLSLGILKRIPPDQKNEWVKKAIQLPYYVQWGLERSFDDEWQEASEPPSLKPEEIEKVNNLVELFSSTDYFPKDYLDNNTAIQKLYIALGRFEGDARKLFTDECIVFFKKIHENGIDNHEDKLDLLVGEHFIKSKRLNLFFDSLFTNLFRKNLIRTDSEITNSDTPVITTDNWKSMLMVYLRNQADVDDLLPISTDSAAKLNTLFEDPKTRDLCLSSLRANWLTYLQNGEPDQMPFSLQYLTEYIKMCDGAGPLSQLESLSTFINSFKEVLSQAPKASTEKTRHDMFHGTAAMEARFVKERWSNEDRTDFYNISADILQAEPRIFTDYLELFQKLSPNDLKRFTREIYPLYRAKLALIEKVNSHDTKTFDMLHLIYLKRDIKNFGRSLGTEEHPFESQRAKLTTEIMGLFKDRFGIIKVPETFTAEHMRSLTNASMYLANLTDRNEDRETILGYYLALSINDRWDDFRKGEDINPAEFITPQKAAEIQALLDQRKEKTPLTAESLGISEVELPEFMTLLQQESQNVMIGDVETIDVKLTNVIINLRGLEDPDLYPEALDKQRLQLALSFGSKKVGSTAAKMYLSLKDPSKGAQFTSDETEVRDEIIKIAQANGFELTAENIKIHFQDGMKPFSTIAGILQFVHESEAEPSINKLRETLQPSQEVTDIFTRLGEDFKPTSGALALSQDLSYLDNLIIKRENELTQAERELLVRYVGVIREQVIHLETIHDQIKNKFSALKQGNLSTDNQLLRDKLDQIGKLIDGSSTQQTVTSTMTGNLNVIIENMRECLSCTRQGVNNDTNLTFGDSNKFYMYSQSEAQVKGSISDEIVFFEPITHADGTKEMAFVFDRVYGTNTPLILTNHVETVLKKYRGLKKRFPQMQLSVFISDSAIRSAGLNDELFTQKLRERLGTQTTINTEQVEVDVAKSAFGDHYVEFGGWARAAGKRSVEGITIRI